jgi:apolipoprotein N-acyltransferase
MYNNFNEPDLPGRDEKNFPYDFLPITLPKYQYGILWILLSTLCCGFGNSLEPVTILAWFHPYCLILGLEAFTLTQWSHVLYVIFFITSTQAIGFTIGFSTIFGYPQPTISTLFQTYAVGLLYWLLITLFALLPHHMLQKKFSYYPSWTLFVYPTCQTVISIVLFGNIVSTFPSIGNSVLDLTPLAYISSLVGLAGIEFYLLLSATWAAHLTIGIINTNSRIFSTFLSSSLLLFIITGFLIQSQTLYQHDINSQIPPKIWTGSCLFGQNEKLGTERYNLLWNQTSSRIQANDNFILWSEEAVKVTSDEEEQALIQKGATLLLTQSPSQETFLGLTYYKKKLNANTATNHFTLLTPTGEIAWNYKKAHPVPGVEDNVDPGPNILPIYHSSHYGTLSGSICFDLDFPNTLRQASTKKVDILFQPSWTWNAISSRHFIGNSLRTIENGFILIRCSSDGESGVVSSKGIIKTRLFTGHDPEHLITFPVAKETIGGEEGGEGGGGEHVVTMYGLFGFVFEWLLVGLMVLCYFLLFAPSEWLTKILHDQFDSEVIG